MTILNKDNFDEMIKSDTPTLVDFWASWCMPCKMLMPIVEEVSNEYAGKVNFGKVNVDDDEELALRYNIYSIPTLIVFKNGEVLERLSGLTSKGNIIEQIEKHL